MMMQLIAGMKWHKLLPFDPFIDPHIFLLYYYLIYRA